MKSTKTLTHSAILGAKPKDKPYKLSDADRLYVLVTVAGKKYWKWNYRLDGKDCTYTLGTFPDVGLSEARERRIAIEKLVQQGIHPSDFDDDQRLMAKAEKAATFWSVAEEWISGNKIKWTPNYLTQVETFMRRYVRDAAIGSRPIRQITTAEIYELVTGVAKRSECKGGERKATGSPTLAIMLRQWSGAVFRLAIVSGRAERNPVADLKASDVIVRQKVKNNRALSVPELREFLKALMAFTGQRTTGIAIELLMLTFVRTTELRAATWGEFDLNNAVWTIPASRMKIKNAGDHVVPLSSQAVTLLRELREIVGTPKTGPHWLFPNYRRESDCMTATTINRALERMGFNGKNSIGFSGHGFRGTASTILHEIGYRPEVIEVQLAHKERNAVKAAYNKAQYMADRIAMMEQWAGYIGSLQADGKAVPLKTGI
ncbi:integrase [Sulfuricella sp. T08]|uniref:tyrosine-type recombinase/integrase n=1 Tax=Sulfuricella sp. T08 TaxID=1632857 RepID=UPI0006179EA3|nr:site-specific integrase [Sulfuricella sp. T08]GAO36706.1 integrase [Sulfuricella sp. T08]